MRTLRVSSGAGPDRVQLAVRVHEREGLPEQAPTVLLVHGYPDTQTVWDQVVERLTDQHRVVTYDVRGAGSSTAPRRRAGYLIARLVDDLVSVLDAVQSPNTAPVHLAAHDWGSVALWDAVCFEAHDPRLRGRIASYCSISGPGLDHTAAFVRDAERDGGDELGKQRRRSWYVAAFHLPLLPDLGWTLLAPLLRAGLKRVERLDGAATWQPTLGRDGRRGLELYRANIRPRLASPAGAGTTRLPLSVVVPRYDRYIGPGLVAAMQRANPHAVRVDLDAGHWVMRSRPDLVADVVAEHVRTVNGPDRKVTEQ